MSQNKNAMRLITMLSTRDSVWPSIVTHTRNLCSAFNPSTCAHAHTHTHTHTHTTHTHFCSCSRAHQSWYRIWYLRINNWQTIWMSSTADTQPLTINTSSDPPLPHTYTWHQGQWVPVLQKEQEKEGTRPRRCDQSFVWKPVLTSWPPSSQRSSTDHWSCAKSPHASNAPPSSPSQRNPR